MHRTISAFHPRNYESKDAVYAMTVAGEERLELCYESIILARVSPGWDIRIKEPSQAPG